jgi:hypothetical protein
MLFCITGSADGLPRLLHLADLDVPALWCSAYMRKRASGAIVTVAVLVCIAGYGSARHAAAEAQPTVSRAVMAQVSAQPIRAANYRSHGVSAQETPRLYAAKAGLNSAMAAAPAASISVISYPNWAGYAVRGGPFRSVSAQWTVPAGHCGHGESQAAFWVGMDMTTVEQTGVALDCSSNGALSYSGWYQMYPSAPVGFSNPVKAGDHMIGSVTYESRGRFTLKLADTTAHWSRSVSANGYRSPRATAEVITEASFGPLANFATVHFGGMMVDGRPVGRDNPQRIDMVASGRQLAGTGGLRADANFDVTWRHG